MASASKTREFVKRNIGQISAVIALIICLVVFAILTKGRSLSANNIKTIFLQAIVVIISAIGTIHVAAHGTQDLSLSATIGLSAALGYTLTPDSADIPRMFFTAMIFGLLFSGFIGVLSANLNVPAIFCAIVGMSVGTKVIQLLSSTNGLIINYAAAAQYDNIYFYLGIALAILAVVGYIFNFTKIGMYNKAIGENIICARFTGINDVKYRIIAYMLSGIASGAAGVARAIRAGSISSTTGSGAHINVMMAIIIGGISITGGSKTRIVYAIVGAIFLQVFSNGLVMIGMNPSLVGLVKGIVFLAAATLSFNGMKKDILI